MNDYINTINQVETNQPKITSITDLQNYARGTVVEFPPFGENQPFVARVRRPSLLIMAKSGKIPNSLLGTANQLFTGEGSSRIADDNLLKDTYDVCRIMAESALIEPSLTDIENAGLELSDDQMMAIFNYTQAGVRALDSFR